MLTCLVILSHPSILLYPEQPPRGERIQQVATHHPLHEFPLPKSVPITEHPARMRALSESAGADKSKDLNPSITPVFPADPKNASVTPVESALPKLLDLKRDSALDAR
jgi:hypothetical protein